MVESLGRIGVNAYKTVDGEAKAALTFRVNIYQAAWNRGGKKGNLGSCKYLRCYRTCGLLAILEMRNNRALVYAVFIRQPYCEITY